MPMGGGLAAGMIGAAVIGPVIGGLIGQQQSAAARAAAQQAAQAALAEINQVGAPPDQAGAILLKHFQSAGVYTPGMENQISAGIAQASQTNTNTIGRQAQVGALGQMQQAANTGYTAVDRAALNNIMQQAGAANQGLQQSVLQGAQSRGEAGGGAMLAAQLQGASASGANIANQSLQQAAQAQQARMAALGQVGQQGSNLSAADFGQAQAKAQAADRFKQFDVTNAIGQQQRNVAAQNQGNLYNLTNAQQISSANTQLDNAETARQLAAAQQNWQEQLQLAGAKSNADLGAAQSNNQLANSTAQQYAGIGAGIGSAAGAGLGYLGKQTATPTTPTTQSNNYSTPGQTGNGQTGLDSSSAGMPVGSYSQGGIIPDHLLSDDHLHAKVKRLQALKKLRELNGESGDVPPGFALGGSVNAADQMMGGDLCEGGEVSPVTSLLKSRGGTVPGKAKVKGDSPKNDTVPANLSPNEMVIPRTIVEKGPDAIYGFAHAVINNKEKK